MERSDEDLPAAFSAQAGEGGGRGAKEFYFLLLCGWKLASNLFHPGEEFSGSLFNFFGGNAAEQAVHQLPSGGEMSLISQGELLGVKLVEMLHV